MGGGSSRYGQVENQTPVKNNKNGSFKNNRKYTNSKVDDSRAYSGIRQPERKKGYVTRKKNSKQEEQNYFKRNRLQDLRQEDSLAVPEEENTLNKVIKTEESLFLEDFSIYEDDSIFLYPENHDLEAREYKLRSTEEQQVQNYDSLVPVGNTKYGETGYYAESAESKTWQYWTFDDTDGWVMCADEIEPFEEDRNQDNWIRLRDTKTGFHYYFNTATGETSWENPQVEKIPMKQTNLANDNENNAQEKSKIPFEDTQIEDISIREDEMKINDVVERLKDPLENPIIEDLSIREDEIESEDETNIEEKSESSQVKAFPEPQGELDDWVEWLKTSKTSIRNGDFGTEILRDQLSRFIEEKAENISTKSQKQVEELNEKLLLRDRELENMKSEISAMKHTVQKAQKKQNNMKKIIEKARSNAKKQVLKKMKILEEELNQKTRELEQIKGSTIEQNESNSTAIIPETTVVTSPRNKADNLTSVFVSEPNNRVKLKHGRLPKIVGSYESMALSKLNNIQLSQDKEQRLTFKENPRMEESIERKLKHIESTPNESDSRLEIEAFNDDLLL